MGNKFDINSYLTTKAESFNTPSDFAKWAVSNGVISENKLRYQAIREYYHSLPHTDRRLAKIETADRFCLSYDRVEEILYRKNL
ncbi:MAG: hypothetical protein II282_06130 [Alistipes sp.]|nr:hypothetical protein [Alistipes sp.]MBQ6584402.1 hypothetical protein [Alistipes sp.]